MQAQLKRINVQICQIIPLKKAANAIRIEFNDIFSSNAKLLPTKYLSGLLEDHLAQMKINTVIATDASVFDEKSGVDIFSEARSWSYSMRLPDFTPIFQAELLAITLALRKLPVNSSTAVIVTNLLSVYTALTWSSDSTVLNELETLIPSTLRLVRLLWVPGHRGLFLNEMADALARTFLHGAGSDVCSADFCLYHRD